MRISLHAIQTEPHKFTFDTITNTAHRETHSEDGHRQNHELNPHWLAQLISQIEAAEKGDDAKKDQTGPVKAHLEVQIVKQEGFWVLDGTFSGQIHLLCARCAEVFAQSLTFSFRTLLSRGSEDSSGLGLGSTPGGAHTLGAREQAEGEELREVDIEFLDDEWLEMNHILREQIYLKIPFQPLCDEACKGLCVTCGQNKNKSPCQCHRLKVGSLGLALKETLKF